MTDETVEGSPDPSGRAERLFADFLAQREAGEKPDFEALCAAHAGLAPRLRRLDEHWREVASVWKQVGFAGSLAERITRRYGT
ncbi:MAG: hypothetical protein ACREIU_06030, partial [Planctomycetota bacterium]